MARIPDAPTGFDPSSLPRQDTPRAQWLRRIAKYDFNMFRTLANSPDVYRAFCELSVAVYVTELSPRLREAVILRVAAMVGSEYEWGGHVDAARAAGLSDETLVGLRDGLIVGLDGREAAAVRFAEGIERGQVSDDDWTAVRAELTDRHMLELTMLAAFYGLAARFTNALEVKLDDGWPGLDHP